MTVGKDDPELRGDAGSGAQGDRRGQRHRPGHRRAVRPAPGTPEVEPYTGLPAELVALNERLLDDHEEAKQITFAIGSTKSNLKQLLVGAEKLSDGLEKLVGASKRLAAGSAKLAREAEPARRRALAA